MHPNPPIYAMKQLSKFQSAVFVIGAILMVVGAAAGVVRSTWAPYVFAPGALLYVSMQLLQRYEGQNLAVRRLRRIMIFSDVLLLATAVLMFASQGNPLGLDWTTYLSYVRNNWVVLLLLAAVLQLYTVYRIGSELEREKQENPS